MKCFYCVARDLMEKEEAVTQYKGTPLCENHAEALLKNHEQFVAQYQEIGSSPIAALDMEP